MLRRRSNDLKLSARWPLSHLREGPPAFGARPPPPSFPPPVARFPGPFLFLAPRARSWLLAPVPGLSHPFLASRARFRGSVPPPPPQIIRWAPISRSIWGTLEELACFCALWRALACSGALSRALARPGGLDEVSPGPSAPRDPVLARVQQCSRPGTAIPNELKRSPNSLAV